MSKLRSSLIKVAYANPNLRQDLLPLITASFEEDRIDAQNAMGQMNTAIDQLLQQRNDLQAPLREGQMIYYYQFEKALEDLKKTLRKHAILNDVQSFEAKLDRHMKKVSDLWYEFWWDRKNPNPSWSSLDLGYQDLKSALRSLSLDLI
jgi:hypothetical protein